jgi:hypothetical protein
MAGVISLGGVWKADPIPCRKTHARAGLKSKRPAGQAAAPRLPFAGRAGPYEPIEHQA